VAARQLEARFVRRQFPQQAERVEHELCRRLRLRESLQSAREQQRCFLCRAPTEHAGVLLCAAHRDGAFEALHEQWTRTGAGWQSSAVNAPQEGSALQFAPLPFGAHRDEQPEERVQLPTKRFAYVHPSFGYQPRDVPKLRALGFAVK